MTTRTIAALLILFAGPDAAIAQEDGESRIRRRLNHELADALADARKRVFELALAELEVARSEAKVDGLANSLVDDPLHNRLKKLLLSKEGKDLVREFMGGQGGAALDDIVGQYFEKSKNGRLRVREDFEETLEQLLDSVAPVDHSKIGVRLAPLTLDERNKLGFPGRTGLRVAEVAAEGAAAKAGLVAGDVLISVDGIDLTSLNVNEVFKQLKSGQEIKVVYLRDRKRTTVGVKPD